MIGTVLKGLFVLVIMVGWGVLGILPWVVIWRAWRHTGFRWWMIPVGLMAMGVTTYLIGLTVFGISCAVKGGPCEGVP